MSRRFAEQTKPQTRSSERPRRVGFLASAALLGLGFALAACSSGASSSSTVATTAVTGSGSRSGSDSITIQNFAFSPTTITVSASATVTVTNMDHVAHTLTATNGGFNTGDIPAGESKTFTAPNTPGSYPYICSIHQYMSGTLVVSG